MKVMDIDSDTLGIPDTDYDARVTMPSSEFSRIVRELSQLSETVKVRTTKKSILFSVDGDVGRGEMELKENTSEKQTEKIAIDVDDEVEASFSLTFLNSFCKGGALSDSVRLLLSENTPLVVEYKIGDLGTLKYYLAPKLQDE